MRRSARKGESMGRGQVSSVPVGVAVESPEEVESRELRDILLNFWLGVVESPEADFAEKVKCSELLAKFILGDGKSVRRREVSRPSTSEVLRLVSELEGRGGRGKAT